MQMPEGAVPADVWNAFWRAVAASDAEAHRFRLKPADRRFHAHFAWLRGASAEHVAFVGNGISVLPHMAACAGLRSWAVDFSSVAQDYVAQHPPHDRYYQAFFGAGSLLASAPSLASAPGTWRTLRTASTRSHPAEPLAIQQPGERETVVSVVVDDVFAWAPVRAMDAIVAQQLIEHVEPARLDVLAAHLAGLLAPGGTLIVESQRLTASIDWSVPYASGSPEAAFERAGFLFRDKDAIIWRHEQERRHRSYWRKLATGAHDDGPLDQEFAARLAACEAAGRQARASGRRVVVFQAAG